MRHWKIDTVLQLLKEAGGIALAASADPGIELKSDQTVVTRADRAIEQMFADRFDRPAEGCFMIGEESVATKPESYLNDAFRSLCYVIDPIDGTAPYSAHVPLWGVSIGRMENGALTEGAIYMPVDDEALFTCRGELFSARALQSGAPVVEPFQPRRMALTPAGHICIPQQGAKRWRFDLPNQVFAWSTCVGCYYALLKGRILAYILSCKLWDLAGGLPIARAAGFVNRFADGRELDLVIAASGNFQLEPGPMRWRLKAPVVAAPDRETAEYVWSHIRQE